MHTCIHMNYIFLRTGIPIRIRVCAPDACLPIIVPCVLWPGCWSTQTVAGCELSDKAQNHSTDIAQKCQQTQHVHTGQVLIPAVVTVAAIALEVEDARRA